ncbi:MAG: two-component system, NtrC family, response regulator AtoC [Acidobacteriota bacterium]|jgi:DNA-binding NtrC family response regulator|nr:two-component system, NtrC family, response regulator AtoC [Acidobacteriota bacterium]
MHALVIDDEAGVRRFVMDVLEEDGWTVSAADTAEAAFDRLRERRWTLVFCDVVLGGEDGYAVLKRFGREQPNARVVLMTGHGSAVGALDATAFGAHDYLLKPFKARDVWALARPLQKHKRKLASDGTTKALASPAVYTSDIALVGRSSAFVEAMKLVGKVAPTNLSVLITGESGTGKEVVARAIHHRSRRSAKAFVAVNCGAIPADLIEAELFGHVRGSFTGAERDRQGLFEAADGGTIFLDEITETTSAFQVKLLRALQAGEIRRVGSSQTLGIDVRVIAATNRELDLDVNEGRFRKDLFYRLNTVSLHLPPLRERREDIFPLIEYFATFARSPGDPDLKFSPEAIALLEAYHWPGNVRELENAVVRAAALCDDIVRSTDLPERIRRSSEIPVRSAEVQRKPDDDLIDARWLTLAEVENRYVTQVLAHTGGNRQAAARLLQIDRKTIDRMLKRNKVALESTLSSGDDGDTAH